MKNKPAKTISVFEFFRLFPDETAAVSFVEAQIWPNGVICSFCGSTKTSIRARRHGHRCNTCRKDFTVRHGTIFENSRLKLKKWLYAIYLLQTSRKGISSLQLSKELGTTQKSAWFVLHRIREACANGTVKFGDVVEVDETYIGGKEKNKHADKKLHAGRGGVGKQAVIGMRERNTGNIKAEPAPDTSKNTLQSFIVDGVTAMLRSALTNTAAIADCILRDTNTKQSTTVRKQYVDGMAHTNGIESFWALLRGHYGTYHHLSVKHLHRYVDEFTFRQNQGNCKIDTINRIKSICSASIGRRLTYDNLVS